MNYYYVPDVLAFEVCREYLSQITAVHVCLEEGNSHDEDFQYCNLVLQKDFVIPEDWKERSTYVAAPIVEYCASTDMAEKKRAFFELLKRNLNTVFGVYTEDRIPGFDELLEDSSWIGHIEYYGMRCELSEYQTGFYLRLEDFELENEAIERGFCKTSAIYYCKPLYNFFWTEKEGTYYLCSDEQKGLNSPEVFEIHVRWTGKTLEDIKEKSNHFCKVDTAR